MKLRCLATCYMPSLTEDGSPLELFEDDPQGTGEGDIYEVDDKLAGAFLATNNFKEM